MTATTTLLRHAHPNFMPNGHLTSQVFFPFPKDEGNLSVYDGDQISPADSYVHYTKTLQNQSHSVWAVTRGEADREGTPGTPDPLPDFPAHAILDFKGKSEKECRKIAKRLKTLAAARGCLYQPQSS